MLLRITKCASSAPDADFADFADLVHSAHSTHYGFLGWSVDWGQYTDDGPLAQAYVEEPAASAWSPVIVELF